MRRRSHIRLFLVATSVWASLLVGGLPFYYQLYSTTTMVILDLRSARVSIMTGSLDESA